jgi:hypothetical protein
MSARMICNAVAYISLAVWSVIVCGLVARAYSALYRWLS